MAKITTTKTHTSGIALGGIGSGSVELLPDGEFHYWLVANQPRLTERCCEKKVDDGEGSAGALSFWVRESKVDSKPVIRKLGMKTDADDFTWHQINIHMFTDNFQISISGSDHPPQFQTMYIHCILCNIPRGYSFNVLKTKLAFLTLGLVLTYAN